MRDSGQELRLSRAPMSESLSPFLRGSTGRLLCSVLLRLWRDLRKWTGARVGVLLEVGALPGELGYGVHNVGHLGWCLNVGWGVVTERKLDRGFRLYERLSGCWSRDVLVGENGCLRLAIEAILGC